MTLRLAASFRSPVEHSDKVTGHLVGLGVGLVAGLVVGAAVVGTGGLALVALTATFAFGGASMGEAISAFTKDDGTETGIITTGSPDTVIGNRPVARAIEDVTDCKGTPPLYLPSHEEKRIAQGCDNVTVNNRFVAREGDKLECGATIAADPPNTMFVLIGGPSVTLLDIDDEFPTWLKALEIGAGILMMGPMGMLESAALGFIGDKLGRGIAAHFGASEEWQGVAGAAGSFLVGLVGMGGEEVAEGEGLVEGEGLGEEGLGEAEEVEAPEAEEAEAEEPEAEEGEGEEEGESEEEGGEEGDEEGGEEGDNEPGDSSEPSEEQSTCEGDPVDVASGAISDARTDLTLPGAFPFEWKRSYSSRRAGRRTAMGYGWTHSFDQWLERDGRVLTLRSGDGRDIHFAAVRPGESTFHRRERLTLTARDDGSFTVHHLGTRLTRELAPLVPGGRAVLRAIRDAHGNAITVQYSGGKLQRIVDTAGREIRIKLDGEARVIRLEVWAQAALQRWCDYAYTARGELASATDALGYVERYAYDGERRLVKKTLRNGLSFHYEFDAATGWCVRTWGDGEIHRVELRPDLAARTTVTAGNEQPRIYTWNDQGVVIREETPDGTVLASRGYDEDLYLLWEENGAGERTSFAYDARGNLIRRVDAAGNTTRWAYEGDRLVREVSPEGRVTRYEYDARGDLTGVHQPTGTRYELGYDERGHVTSVTSDGLAVSFAYDAHHNPTWESGSGARYTYDALGRPVVKEDAARKRFSAEYDALGRLVAATLPDGAVTRYEHGPLGELVRQTDPGGRVTVMEHLGTAELHRLTHADGSVWRFQRDSRERLRQVVNPRGETLEMVVDAAGNVTREVTFEGCVIGYRRDAAGRMTRVDYPDGSWREITYDRLGHVVEERGPGGACVYERDRMGRLMRARAVDDLGEIVVTLERDARGRVVAETQGSALIRRTYDARGRLLSRTLPDGTTTHYRHGRSGALAAIEHRGVQLVLERDAVGREVRRTAGAVTIERAYDPWDRLTELRASAARPGGGRVDLARRSLTRDAAGWLQCVEDSRAGRTEYEHSVLGQLLSASAGTARWRHAYDAAGSLRGALHEQDARGRRTRRDVPGGAVEYTWDWRDCLREVRLPSGGRVRFRYDAFGRRVSKEIVDSDGATRRVGFVWDGDELAAEIGAGCTTVFVHEPGTLIPALQDEGGRVLVYVNDHLGMPKELVDPDGQLVWAAQHSPWGQVIEVTRAPGELRAETPFRLLGQYADVETGLCYTRYRYFDPEVGRWCSPDPLGLAGGRNVFDFDGSPVMVVDPLGLNTPPSLPDSTIFEGNGWRIVHHYDNMAGEHAYPVHFHVEDNHGNTITRIRGDGTPIHDDPAPPRKIQDFLDEGPNKNRLRHMEDRIVRTIQHENAKPYGQDFRPGDRGPPGQGCK